MTSTYFWDGQQVIAVPGSMTVGDAKPYLDMPCVDPVCSVKAGRYGVFTKRKHDTDVWSCQWIEWSVDLLPKEFRAHLLLLGVS